MYYIFQIFLFREMSYTHLFIAVFLLHQAVGQEKISGTGEFSKQQYLQNEIQESPSEENVSGILEWLKNAK